MQQNSTCNFSGICFFCNFVILAPIATIFIYQMHSRTLKLMVLTGASANYVTFLVLAWKSSFVLYQASRRRHTARNNPGKLSENCSATCRDEQRAQVVQHAARQRGQFSPFICTPIHTFRCKQSPPSWFKDASTVDPTVNPVGN